MHKKRTITAVVTSGVAFLVAVFVGGNMSLFDMDTALLQGAISNWETYDSTIDITTDTTSFDTSKTTTDTDFTTEDTNDTTTDSTTDSATETTTESTTETTTESTTDISTETTTDITDSTYDTSSFNEENDTFTTQLQEKTCPYSASIDERVIDFSNSNHVAIIIPKGIYTISLASYYVEHTSDTVHIPWRITLLDSEQNTVFTSNTARGARADETLAVERVNTEVAIDSVAYGVHARPDGENFGNTKPLCASLKRVRELEMTYTTTDIQEQFDTRKEDITNTFTEKSSSTQEAFEERRDAMLTQYENTDIEDIRTGILTHDDTEDFTGPQQADNSEEEHTRTVQEYVEVQPYSIGMRMQNETITVAKQIAETRARILEEFEKDSLFDALQENKNDTRTRIREKITQLEKEKNEVTATFPETLQRVIVSEKEIQRKEVNDSKAVFQSFRLKKRAVYEHTTDTDGDGITDYDETYLYDTDPENPFTGGSALTDGERLLLGLNPAEAEYNAVTVESPQTAGTILQDIFTVKDIAYTQDDPGNLAYVPPKKVQIQGQAQPYAFVTLYIYSTPIVVTVRSDEAGKFEYTLDKTLEDGSHELYIATVNNSGKILAKSDAIPFVQTAEAIEYTPAAVSKIDGPVDDAMQTLIILALILLLLIGLGVTVILGYIKSHHNTDEEQQGIEHG